MEWALINFFCLYDGRLFEVGANSRLGAYSNEYGIRFCPRYFENLFHEPEMDYGESTTQISVTKDSKEAEVLCLLHTY